MLRRLISATLALSLLATAKADDNVVRMDDITSLTVFGDQVFMVHADLATTLTHIDHLVVLWHAYQRSLGEESEGGTFIGIDDAAGTPQVFTASYRDHDGILHQIVTNCAKLQLANCIKKHHAAVKAMTEVFMPRAM